MRSMILCSYPQDQQRGKRWPPSRRRDANQIPRKKRRAALASSHLRRRSAPSALPGRRAGHTLTSSTTCSWRESRKSVRREEDHDPREGSDKCPHSRLMHHRLLQDLKPSHALVGPVFLTNYVGGGSSGLSAGADVTRSSRGGGPLSGPLVATRGPDQPRQGQQLGTQIGP